MPSQRLNEERGSPHHEEESNDADVNVNLNLNAPPPGYSPLRRTGSQNALAMMVSDAPETGDVEGGTSTPHPTATHTPGVAPEAPQGQTQCQEAATTAASSSSSTPENHGKCLNHRNENSADAETVTASAEHFSQKKAPPPPSTTAAATAQHGPVTTGGTFPPQDLPPDFQLFALSRSEFLKGPALFFEKEDMEAYLQQANAPLDAKHETFDNFKEAAVYLLKDYLTNRMMNEQQQQRQQRQQQLPQSQRPTKKPRTIDLNQKRASTNSTVMRRMAPPAPLASVPVGPTPIAPAPPMIQHHPYSQHQYTHQSVLMPAAHSYPPGSNMPLVPIAPATGAVAPPFATTVPGVSPEQGRATTMAASSSRTRSPVPIAPKQNLVAMMHDPSAMSGTASAFPPIAPMPPSHQHPGHHSNSPTSFLNNPLLNTNATAAAASDAKFEQKLLLLEEFKTKYGHVRVNAKKCERKFRCLQKWLYSVRSALRRYEQDPQSAGVGWDETRVQRLKALGVDPDETDHHARWERNFALLLEFKDTFGHCFVPSRTDKLDDEKWHPLSHFREFNMKHMKFFETDPSKSNLTQERYDRLREVVGDWRMPKDARQKRPYQKNPSTTVRKREKEETKFAEMFQRLEQYKEAGGNVNEHPDDKVKRWVTNQRSQYRNLKEKKATTLTNDRLARLSNLGLRLKSDQEYYTFDERSLQWLEAGGNTGHIKDRALRDWVKKTKVKYIKWKRGEKTNLTQERVDKLTQFGFQWPTQLEIDTYDPTSTKKKRLSWDERFQQLLEVSM